MFSLQGNFDFSQYLATFTSPQVEPTDYHNSNLPASAMGLVGRGAEVRAVKTLLQRPEIRLLTLTGVAGVGKTHLGLEIARELSSQFRDGVFFVEIASVRDPALLISIIAQTLKLRNSDDQPLIETLKAYLQAKQLLLLIDNFEQVVMAAPILSLLLAEAPGLKILVTSRVALGVCDEQEFEVPPLGLPDPKQLASVEVLAQCEAVAMFVQRVRLVRSNFNVNNENSATVAKICICLDGLPLAIELAAARLKLLTLPLLLERLTAFCGARLKLLTIGRRDLPQRQQTLRNAINWSYELLSPGEQKLFRALGVFAGGCTLEAVEEVCEVVTGEAFTFSIFEGLAGLVTKNMLRHGGTLGPDSRFWLLETWREYALEQLLAESSQEEDLRRRHADYYLKLAQIGEMRLRDSDQAAWLDRIETDHDNFRAALDWLLEQGEIEKAGSLSCALALFWWIRGFLSEGQHWLRRVLGEIGPADTTCKPKELPDALRLKSLSWLAVFTEDQANKALLEESLALQTKVTDKWLVAFSLWSLSSHAGHFSPLDYLQKSLDLFRESGDKWGTALALERLGFIRLFTQKYALARPLLEESLELSRTTGDRFGTALVLNWLGNLANLQNQHRQAVTFLKESLGLAREIKASLLEARVLNGLGWAAFNQANYYETRSNFEQVLTIDQKFGKPFFTAISLANLGLVEIYGKNYVVAKTYFEKSLEMFLELKNNANISLPVWGFAQIAQSRGHLLQVAQAVRQSYHQLITAVYNFEYAQVISALCDEMCELAFTWAKEKGNYLRPEKPFNKEEEEEQLQILVNWALPLTSQPAKKSLLALAAPALAKNRCFKKLTPREIEVLKLIARGLSNSEVAEQLALSPRTVNAHLTSIYVKLRVHSRTAAACYALNNKII